MTTKKSETTTGESDAANAQKKMNELYTAHQVHTLAHLIFQQITAGWSAAQPWAAQAGPTATTPMPGHPQATSWPTGAGMAQHGAASPNGAPQPLMYWYP